MDERPQCSRCDGDLTLGFIEDKADRGSNVLSWIGEPSQTGAFGGAKVMGKKRQEVKAFRCKKCGHLDLFVY